MGKLSLKATVLLAMGVLVVSSCLLTAFIAAERYSQSLEQALTRHARSITQSLAGPIAEMVLINDIIGVQRLLDTQFDRDIEQGYALLEIQGRVYAHTFEHRMPDILLPPPVKTGEPHEAPADAGMREEKGVPAGVVERIVTLSNGRRYHEIAWPLLDGHAGVLRMGFSQRDIDMRISQLWKETAGLTFIILLLALIAGTLWLRRVGRPLAALSRALDSVGRGNLTTRVAVYGQNEVAVMARAFNSMSEKLEGTMLSMEAQAAALHRSHRQLRLCNDIVTAFAALDGLEIMARRLPDYLSDIAPVPYCLLFLEHDRNCVVTAQGRACTPLFGRDAWDSALQLLEGRENVFTTSGLKEPLASPEVSACPCQTVVCIVHEHVLCGALIAGHGPKGMDEADLAALALVLNQIAGSISRALRYEKESRGQRLHDGVDNFNGMLGRSSRMRAIFQRIADVASSDATVLITGESGTGKELAARAIHNLSGRREKPFVVINCAAYPESLLESELFGYEKGAFTGALRQKPGRFEQADGGTVFLDEIGEISPVAQVRLLRVLQTRQFERVGGEETLTVNVRVLAATNRDLAAEVRKGQFREDLYYRLDVISLVMPPLRDRPGDLPLLARHFLESLARRTGRQPCTLSPAAIRLLMAYDWPGNVRELENMLEQCATLSRHGAITPADLPERMRVFNVSGASGRPSSISHSAAAQTLEDKEATAIREALEHCAWSRKDAAARLGIGRTTLYSKMKRYGIRPPEAS
ncbi:sigma 54-interacting transcriptional regulator [Desulfovibrio sp. 86]|uniref:HAMP domain protein n=1 Tax=uncultured Desulfovibrio sp. TaxID=167968 RepID=A0A212L6A2_9BACT|nr:sigma 54-interacting transcriptional regulator [Desulfovibrio sp. 86]SCM73048.1 HAMP domain protein [uncultured Desulfovibrio sp.]VZH33900.1 HAMP domain protein [Desulfovibrio sp. 86]